MITTFALALAVALTQPGRVRGRKRYQPKHLKRRFRGPINNYQPKHAYIRPFPALDRVAGSAIA